MSSLLDAPPLNPRHEIFHVERILLPEGDPPPRRDHRIIAVLPAYNAEQTLAATLADVPVGSVDEFLLVDDGSTDRTVQVARDMGLTVIEHPENRGYGGNQKTCYRYALEHGADIVVMIHPDYQYDSRVIPHAVGIIELGICDIVLGSRIRSRDEALRGGMPVYKYLSNRFLTALENFALGQNLGDFHSGFRVYRRGGARKGALRTQLRRLRLRHRIPGPGHPPRVPPGRHPGAGPLLLRSQQHQFQAERTLRHRHPGRGRQVLARPARALAPVAVLRQAAV